MSEGTAPNMTNDRPVDHSLLSFGCVVGAGLIVNILIISIISSIRQLIATATTRHHFLSWVSSLFSVSELIIWSDMVRLMHDVAAARTEQELLSIIDCFSVGSSRSLPENIPGVFVSDKFSMTVQAPTFVCPMTDNVGYEPIAWDGPT